MGSRICMNTFCGTALSPTWKKGWQLKSGQIADLCFNCGSVYEKLAYCNTFHFEETGWRECNMCNKLLHCGCSASLQLIEIQDFGGVWCINCANSVVCHKSLRDTLPSEAPKHNSYISCELQNPESSYNVDRNSHTDRRLSTVGIPSDAVIFGLQMKIKSPIKFAYKGFENFAESLKLAKADDDQPKIRVRDAEEQKILPSLNIDLGTSDSKSSSIALSACTEVVEKKRPHLSQSTPQTHYLPKPAKTDLDKSSEANKGSSSQKRMGRPPAEARLHNQVLPRYWPRITDQDLHKLSGVLNSTIVPLFEKVLSASDASRIGRLVLPKACAEAYFPQIQQPEGLPMKIQDVKGKEWEFQFRFWPNNNSRMYVLEGVTAFIQTMQLQAADTVIFSRIDPGGKFIIGSRKTSSYVGNQDKQTSAPLNGIDSEENLYSDFSDSAATVNGNHGLHFLKGRNWSTLNVLVEQSDICNGDMGWSKNDNSRRVVSKDLLRQAKVMSEAKALTVGSKRKRSSDNDYAMELRITLKEAQDLFHPPLHIQPNTILIEEFDFEEYDEPPVFGKRTLFTTRLLGRQDQWAQCDDCGKWRKLPCDAFVPPKWSCLDNVWDISRSSCPAPAEITAEELDLFEKVCKKRKAAAVQGCGFDALANAAVVGDDGPSTTRHPRHRPGCTCIVCIQPPSGKGNHEPNCLCNVCSTVRWRFMTRKKVKRSCPEKAPHKRFQSDNSTKESEPSSLVLPPEHKLKVEVRKQEGRDSNCKEIIDLNCHPVKEDDAGG